VARCGEDLVLWSATAAARLGAAGERLLAAEEWLIVAGRAGRRRREVLLQSLDRFVGAAIA
jgi:hypothetical protein